MGESNKYYIKRCLDGHPDDFRYLVRRYQAVLLDRGPVFVYNAGSVSIAYWHGWQGEAHLKLCLRNKIANAE